MGLFEDMFDSSLLQRRDIEGLRAAVLDSPTPHRVAALEARVAQLRLLCNTLAEALVRKEVLSREELQVLGQQMDLLDGVEDGAAGAVRAGAPRCRGCGNFVNPRRVECIYCGVSVESESVEGGGPYRGARTMRTERTATCARCGAVSAQSETYFSEAGELVCFACQ